MNMLLFDITEDTDKKKKNKNSILKNLKHLFYFFKLGELASPNGMIVNLKNIFSSVLISLSL